MGEDKDLHLSEHEGKLDNLDDAILGGDNSEESFFKGFKLWAEIGVGVGDVTPLSITVSKLPDIVPLPEPCF